MANIGLLESMRSAAEDIEAMELALVEELESVQRKTHKSKLAQELRIRNILVAARDRAKRIKTLDVKSQGGLSEFYRRKDQIATTSNNSLAIAVADEDPQTVARLSALGGEISFATEEEERAVLRPRNRLERREARARIDEFVLSHERFTGEEHLGRYLDLHESHMMFQNMHPSLVKVSYLEYLRTRIYEVPLQNIVDIDQAAYASYIKSLLGYLQEFEARALPLSALGQDQASDLTSGVKEKPFESELKRATSPADLESWLSLSQLKEALESRGLKASGRLQERASRLFAVKGLTPDQYPLDLLSASSSTQQPGAVANDLKQTEERVKSMLDRIRPLVQQTQTMINKKLTMTYEEIAQELRDEEKELEAVERSDEEDEADEDEEAKLKMNGVIDPATGRLIPKWKFKLYGLNQEFKCEICGDHTYFGRKAFDKHFRDFRHANGMRALGIPNTAHFHDITSINEAKTLYASLRKELERGEFNQQNEEEFEDSQGTVLSKSAYEDLKREGLL